MKYLCMKHFSQPKIGFTLAEIMVVLFVLTVILAAFAPMMTTRTKTGGTSPWRYASPDTANAYFGAFDNQTAMIGQSTKSSDDIDSKLIINTPEDTAAILFKQNDAVVGQLFQDVGSLILGGRTDEVYEGISNTTAIGYNALGKAITGGTNSVAVGYKALGSATTGGSYSVAVGYNALGSVDTEGTNNTAIGHSALSSNTSGKNNTAIGRRSSINNTTGDANTAIGMTALSNNSTGKMNTAIGYNALSSSTGDYNTAVGSNACYDLDSSYTTCIGAYSGPNSSSYGTTTLYLGNQNTTTYNPGSLNVTGATTLESTLDVAGAATFNGVDNIYISSGLSLANYISTYLSDARLKNIAGENTTGLDKIKQMKTYDYTFKSDKKSTPHTGVIAQEVQKFFPEAVVTGEDGYLKIRKDALFFAVINAIKELAAHDSDKDLKIQELEKKNAELEERLLKLEEKMETLSAKTQKKK